MLVLRSVTFVALVSCSLACGGNCPPTRTGGAAGSVELDHESTTDTHQAAALELLDAIHYSDTLAAAMELSLAAQLQAQPNLRPMEGTLRRFFQKYMTAEHLAPQMAAAYVARFTELELQQLIEFYRSPIGQRSLVEQPALMQEGARIGGSAVEAHRDELIHMLEQDAAGGVKSHDAP